MRVTTPRPIRFSDAEWDAIKRIAAQLNTTASEVVRQSVAIAHPADFRAEFRTGGRLPDEYVLLKEEYDALVARQPSYEEDKANGFEWRSAMDDWLDEVLMSEEWTPEDFKP